MLNVRILTVLVLLASLLPMVQPAYAEQGGRFTVLDGDTVELDGRVIDLVGIDAPEFGQHCRRGDVEVDCGMIARTQLLDLTAGSTVTCDLESSSIRTGWPAVAVCRSDGYDLSEGMLHTGWALADPTSETPSVYLKVQTASQQAGRGLWGFAFIQPWEWRQGLRLGANSSQ